MPDSRVSSSNLSADIVGCLNPFSIFRHLWQYQELIRQLTWREVIGRYKGSFIGLGWSFIHPLLMLCIYTFVFSVIFNAKWGVSSEEGRAAFALTLFMGMITFNLFAETVNTAPILILANASYVKKVVFPLEILPVITFLNALINALFSLTILFVGIISINHFIHPSALLLPLVWLPLMLFSLGCGFFLASLGVFIRDVKATVEILTTMLFFLSPIFYPVRAVPESLRFFIQINPIAVFVENSRRVVLWGLSPDWGWFMLGLLFSSIVFSLGFFWFMQSKKAFADVL